MRLNEREQLPPPPGCNGCESHAVYQGVSADMSRIETRSRCVHRMTGGLMHPDCQWFSARRGGQEIGK